MRSMLIVACLALAACNGDDGENMAGMSGDGACLPALELDCDPTFTPTFDEIYDRELRSCGANGSLCHGAEGDHGGLTLADRDGAYDALLGIGEEHARVIPGDPECSILIQRLESTDANFVMPRGTPLTPGKRCAIRQWVANGAERR